MSHSLASAKNNSCYLFALFMLYLYVSTEMERVFNLKQVHRPIQLNCSGLWESKQKKYFDNTPLQPIFNNLSESADCSDNMQPKQTMGNAWQQGKKYGESLFLFLSLYLCIAHCLFWLHIIRTVCTLT